MFTIKVDKPVHLMHCSCEECACIYENKQKPTDFQVVPKLISQDKFGTILTIPTHQLHCDCSVCQCIVFGANNVKLDGKKKFALKVEIPDHSMNCYCEKCICTNKNKEELTRNRMIPKINMDKKFGMLVEIPIHKLSCDCTECQCADAGENNVQLAEIKQVMMKVKKPDQLMTCSCEKCNCPSENKVKPKWCKTIWKDLKFQRNVKKPNHRIQCDCEECQCEIESKQKGNENEIGQMSNLYEEVEGFWLRFYKVVLEREFYIQKRADLMKHNEKLKFILKQYMKSLNPPFSEILGSKNLE